ncbi:MAG: SCO family protein, partial [Aquificota bacterium]
MGSLVRQLFGGLFALLLFLSLCFAQEGSTGIPPNESRTLGKPLPDVMFVDSDGKKFNLYSLKGKPIILSPIYTNCSSACPIITDSLKKVVPKLGTPGVDFWVLSLTFDPTDNLENIKAFAQKHNLDRRGWKVVMVENKEDLFK